MYLQNTSIGFEGAKALRDAARGRQGFRVWGVAENAAEKAAEEAELMAKVAAKKEAAKKELKAAQPFFGGADPNRLAHAKVRQPLDL